MKLLFFCTLIIALNPFPFTLTNLESKAHVLNLVCLKSTPSMLLEKKSWQALVCGSSNLDLPLRSFLINSGLIHIFVVSGAQLIILDKILLFIPIPLLCQRILLFLYVLICNLQGPITRAFASLVLGAFFSSKGLSWRSDSKVLIVGIILIIMFPDWSNSLSFYLSWLAALGLTLPHRNKLQQGLIIYILLLPPLAGIANLHPITILFNLFLGPLIGFFLFPLALAVLIVPWLAPALDMSIQILRSLSAFFENSWIYFPSKSSDLSLELLWTWLFLVHWCWHLYQTSTLRKGI